MTLDSAAMGLIQQTDAIEALQDKITALTEQVAALTMQSQRKNFHLPASLQFFWCNQSAHIQHNFSNRFRHCYMCGRTGQASSEFHLGNGGGAAQMGNGRP